MRSWVLVAQERRWRTFFRRETEVMLSMAALSPHEATRPMDPTEW